MHFWLRVGRTLMAKRPLDPPGPVTDSLTLATKSATGDKAAYGALMRHWQQPLWRIAKRYTGDAGESEDIVQEVFVAFWRTLTKPESGDSSIPRDVGAFLRRATLNACRDWSRRRAVRAFFFSAIPFDPTRDQATPQLDPSSQTTDLETLEHLIAQLPTGLKGPLILCALEGLGQKEAAVVLGLSQKAVETRVARAKQMLRRKWPMVPTA